MEVFKNKVCFITGAASGFGRGISLKLGSYGAILVLADVNMDGLTAVVNQIKQSGGQAEAHYLNVIERNEIHRLISETYAKYGQLDYVFNNAGIGMGGETYAMEMEDWQKIIDINLWSVIQGTHTAYQIMKNQGFGHIINTASMLGLISGPFSTAYATAKHAVYGLSRSLRSEAKDFGVKVTAICPGFVNTNILKSAQMFEISYEEMMKMLPYKLMELEPAVEVILKGIKNNRDLIVFPAHARVSWWLNRHFRGLANWANELIIRRYRKDKITKSK
jgi:NAD(P)-dependent dehydrogenase (short-subunit alcohol dehydrogenase family)